MLGKPCRAGPACTRPGFFSAPDSEHFARTPLSKANGLGGGSSQCALQARLAPGEGWMERCLWCAEGLSCLLWMALDLVLKKICSGFVASKTKQPGSTSEKGTSSVARSASRTAGPKRARPNPPYSSEFMRVCKVLRKGLGG